MFCSRCAAKVREGTSVCPVCHLCLAGPDDVTQPNVTSADSNDSLSEHRPADTDAARIPPR